VLAVNLKNGVVIINRRFFDAAVFLIDKNIYLP